MFKISMSVHAKDRNGEGFNILLHPVNEQAEPYGFFLQSPPTGSVTALVNKGVAGQLEVGTVVEVTLTPKGKPNESIAGDSSGGDTLNSGQAVSDVAAERPGHRRAR